MPIVTVNPIQTISVRVGPASPAAVQSTATFLGASDQITLIEQVSNTANAAYVEANAATSQVNTAFVLANTAYNTANNALPIAGGEITGNLKVDGQIYGNIYVVDAGTY